MLGGYKCKTSEFCLPIICGCTCSLRVRLSFTRMPAPACVPAPACMPAPACVPAPASAFAPGCVPVPAPAYAYALAFALAYACARRAWLGMCRCKCFFMCVQIQAPVLSARVCGGRVHVMRRVPDVRVHVCSSYPLAPTLRLAGTTAIVWAPPSGRPLRRAGSIHIFVRPARIDRQKM